MKKARRRVAGRKVCEELRGEGVAGKVSIGRAILQSQEAEGWAAIPAALRGKLPTIKQIEKELKNITNPNRYNFY